jgi:single-stranded DNA-binding protein
LSSSALILLTAWEELADECGRLLHAGDRIMVEGQLRLVPGEDAVEPAVQSEIVLERIVLLPQGDEWSEP